LILKIDFKNKKYLLFWYISKPKIFEKQLLLYVDVICKWIIIKRCIFDLEKKYSLLLLCNKLSESHGEWAFQCYYIHVFIINFDIYNYRDKTK
jgi:hypothetical protein